MLKNSKHGDGSHTLWNMSGIQRFPSISDALIKSADSTTYNHFNSYAIITFNFKAHSTLKSIQFLKVSEIS